MVGTTIGQELQIICDGPLAVVRMRRPPHNFLDRVMVAAIADALHDLDGTDGCRAVVLAAEGKSFCGGADLRRRPTTGLGDDIDPDSHRHLYKDAVRLFRTRKPIVAAVQGAAIGGGLGLAMAADFRVTCAEASFSANFTQLGFHPGMGLSVTLPRAIGQQKASLLLLTGRRISGREASEIGLVDRLVESSMVEAAACEFAREIARAAPLAVLSTRQTLRRGLAETVEAATERELFEQTWLRRTTDFAEGVMAASERREPNFQRR